MRKWELIKQNKLLVIKSKILSNLLNEKYGFKLGEFNNTAGTERVNIIDAPSLSKTSCDKTDEHTVEHACYHDSAVKQHLDNCEGLLSI